MTIRYINWKSSGSKRHRVFEERNKSNNRIIKEEDSGEAKDISNGRKKEREQTEEVKLISRDNHGALQWRGKA